MSWTIYCHTHVETSRRYVGMTAQTMERRWASHVTKARSSKGGRWHFPNAIRKYGKDAFSHEVLEICHDIEVANLAEECWIELFDTRNPEKGFNLAKGGLHVPCLEKRNPWDAPGFKERVVKSLRERNQDPGYRAVRSRVSNEVLSRPGVRMKLSSATSFQFSTPEARALQSDRTRALHARPGYTEASMVGFRRHAATVAARTHCKHGHGLTPENVRVDKRGWQSCRECDRERQRRS